MEDFRRIEQEREEEEEEEFEEQGRELEEEEYLEYLEESEEEDEEEFEEDRISQLPDDLIHRILSLNDAKFAVQTCLLSTRWKNLWKSLSHLNFDDSSFTRIDKFSKFLSQCLRHRDPHSHLSVVNLKFCGAVGQANMPAHLPGEIAVYGASHNLQHLTIISLTDIPQLPRSLFAIQSLTTLLLYRLSFKFCCYPRTKKSKSKSVGLFSRLLNLKNLTLIECDVNCDPNGLKKFYISSPQLETLEITSQYQCYLLAESDIVISAPKLSLFKYKGNKPKMISSSNLNSLDTVYIDLTSPRGYLNCKQSLCHDILQLFHQLRAAKFVTLSEITVSTLLGVFEQLKIHPSPFHKLECLKIESDRPIPTSSSTRRLLTYLCSSSPATSSVIN